MPKKRKAAIRELPSTFCDTRAAGAEVDTIVLHTMWAPGAPDPFSVETCKLALDASEVSAHYLIGRTGDVWRCVAEERRAWHAGVSRMPFADDTREAVNHFSIGIELIASSDSGCTEEQYGALVMLIGDLAKRHPIRNVVGHNHIAPDRKSDPWSFDWARVIGDLNARRLKLRVAGA